MTNTGASGTWAKTTGFLAGMTMLLVAACGGSEAKSDETQIQDTVRTFFNFAFLGKGSGDTAYDLLDEESRGACSKDQFIQDSKDAQELFEGIGGEIKLKSISDVKVTGDSATAKIDITLDGESSDSADEPLPFKKEGGKWRISEGC